MSNRSAPGRDAEQDDRTLAARKRRPMSAPRQKLSMPDIPGYHTHWINDYPGRTQQAEQAGYEFVDRSEVNMNDYITPGNSDLGTRVSCIVGRGEGNTPLRAYAMKIKLELYEEDQALLQERNDMVDQAIRAGRMRGEGQHVDREDIGKDYLKQATLQTNLRRRF